MCNRCTTLKLALREYDKFEHVTGSTPCTACVLLKHTCGAICYTSRSRRVRLIKWAIDRCLLCAEDKHV